MRITALIENTSAADGITAEHGLSLCLEIGARRVLFDAGQMGAFADNAARLGIELAAVDTAILSHGHYDHGGGLARFLALNDHAPIHLTHGAFGAHYNGAEKYIGLDPALRESGRLLAQGYPQSGRVVPARCAGGRVPLQEARPRRRRPRRAGRGGRRSAALSDAILHLPLHR